VKSQTVRVEPEVDLLVPFGSNIIFAGLDPELVALDGEEVLPIELELGTVPIVFAVPIG
jgi:hypothetical protein